mgnify:CR=1 FL=1
MVTPYVAQVLLRTSLYAAVSAYTVLGFIAAIVSWWLPVETKGLDLNDAGWVANKGRIRFKNEDDADTSLDGSNKTAASGGADGESKKTYGNGDATLEEDSGKTDTRY